MIQLNSNTTAHLQLTIVVSFLNTNNLFYNHNIIYAILRLCSNDFIQATYTRGVNIFTLILH